MFLLSKQKPTVSCSTADELFEKVAIFQKNSHPAYASSSRPPRPIAPAFIDRKLMSKIELPISNSSELTRKVPEIRTGRLDHQAGLDYLSSIKDQKMPDLTRKRKPGLRHLNDLLWDPLYKSSNK